MKNHYRKSFLVLHARVFLYICYLLSFTGLIAYRENSNLVVTLLVMGTLYCYFSVPFMYSNKRIFIYCNTIRKVLANMCINHRKNCRKNLSSRYPATDRQKDKQQTNRLTAKQIQNLTGTLTMYNYIHTVFDRISAPGAVKRSQSSLLEMHFTK